MRKIRTDVREEVREKEFRPEMCECRMQTKSLDRKESKQMGLMRNKGFVGKREMKKIEREEARERERD